MANHSDINAVKNIPEIMDQYSKLQAKFQQACSQVILLNNKIVDANVRYTQASKSTNKTFMYTGRLKLMTLEGVRNTIYEYAARLADVIDEEQEKLVAMGLMQEEYEPMETNS